MGKRERERAKTNGGNYEKAFPFTYESICERGGVGEAIILEMYIESERLFAIYSVFFAVYSVFSLPNSVSLNLIDERRSFN